MDPSECDGPLKQILWSLYQSESFTPNDTRVATKRLSEQGLRGVLKRLTHLTSTASFVGASTATSISPSASELLAAVRMSVSSATDGTAAMPPPEVVHLGRLHRMFASDAFHTRCWVAMVSGKPLSSTNWTAFGAAFLQEFKATLAADWTNQVQEQLDRGRGADGNVGDRPDGGTVSHHAAHRRGNADALRRSDTAVEAAQQQQSVGSLAGVDEAQYQQNGQPSSRQPSPRLTVERRRSKSPTVSEMPSQSARAVPEGATGLMTDATPMRSDARRSRCPLHHHHHSSMPQPPATEEPCTIELALSPLVDQHYRCTSSKDDEESPKILGMVKRHVDGSTAPHPVPNDGTPSTSQQGDVHPAPGGPGRVAPALSSAASHSRHPPVCDANASVVIAAASGGSDARHFTSGPGMPVFMPSPSVSQPQHSSPPRRPQRRGDGERTPSSTSTSSCALSAPGVPDAAIPAGAPTQVPVLHRSQHGAAMDQQRIVVPAARETFESGPAGGQLLVPSRHAASSQQPHHHGTGMQRSTAYTMDFGATSPILAPAAHSYHHHSGTTPRRGAWPPEPSPLQDAWYTQQPRPGAWQEAHGTEYRRLHQPQAAPFPYGSSSTSAPRNTRGTSNGFAPPLLPEATLYDARYNADVNQRVRSHCIALFHAPHPAAPREEEDDGGYYCGGDTVGCDASLCGYDEEAVGGCEPLDDSFGLYPIDGAHHNHQRDVMLPTMPPPQVHNNRSSIPPSYNQRCHPHGVAVSAAPRQHPDNNNASCCWSEDPRQEVRGRAAVVAHPTERRPSHAVSALGGTPISKAAFFEAPSSNNAPQRCAAGVRCQPAQGSTAAHGNGTGGTRHPVDAQVGRSAMQAHHARDAPPPPVVLSRPLAVGSSSSAPADPISEPPSQHARADIVSVGTRSACTVGGPSTLPSTAPMAPAATPSSGGPATAKQTASASTSAAPLVGANTPHPDGAEASATVVASSEQAAPQPQRLRVPLRTIALQELFPGASQVQPLASKAAQGCGQNASEPPVAHNKRRPPPPPATLPRSTSPSTGRTSSPSMRVPQSRPKSPVQSLAM